MPRFSIVIPTYNRADVIGRAIDSALAQSYPDVEVIVSDNASTDNTREIVRGYGDRVRYHRNETNLGLWGNFGLSPSLATGEYFSWLTDDDYIRQDFVARAVRALSTSEDVKMYVCWAAYSRSPTSIKTNTTMHGPLIPIDWFTSEATVVDGLIFAPLMFFESQAMPPAVAYRTAAASRGVKDLLPDCLQYNEYIIGASIASMGRVAIDPWIGAIHTNHENQAHLISSRDVTDMLRQKRAHAEFYQRFMPGLPDQWRPLFRETLRRIPIEHGRQLVAEAVHSNGNTEAFWADAPTVVLELRDMVLDSLPVEERNKLRRLCDPSKPSGLRHEIKKIIPPRLRTTLRAALGAWRSPEIEPR